MRTSKRRIARRKMRKLRNFPTMPPEYWAGKWFDSVKSTLRKKSYRYQVFIKKDGYDHVGFDNHPLIQFGVFHDGELVAGVLMEHVDYELVHDPGLRILYLYVDANHRRKKLGLSMASACFMLMHRLGAPFFWASNNDGDSEGMRALLKTFGLTESPALDASGKPFLRMRVGLTRNNLDEMDIALADACKGYMEMVGKNEN